MPITAAMVLPPDVLVTAVARLATPIRQRLGSPRGGYVITRPGSRSPSRLLDRQAARLLEHFRTPTRIVDAVHAFSRRHRLDPAATLADAFPVLSDCLDQQLLVDADSPAAGRIEPALARGERVGVFSIVAAIQALEDTEVYQGAGPDGTTVAIKISRPGATAAVGRQLRREANVLRRLNDAAIPALLGSGAFEGRPYLALSWCPGTSPLVAAAELRGNDGAAGRPGLLTLCTAIAGAYARLHARGVVHGDVHPGNLLVDGRGRIVLLDFGLARFIRGALARSLPKGGVAWYLSPEFASAWLRRSAPPPPTPRSEQYAVAALLYQLVTGEHYLDLPFNRRAAHRYIATAPPLPFARRGVQPWPALEAILARALHKQPALRFESMKAFAAALQSIPAERGAPPGRSRPITVSPADRLCGETLSRLASRALLRGGLATAPLSSIQLGGAGIAYALYRIACIRDDPGLLSLADVWQTRAERDACEPRGLVNAAQGVTPDTVGRISLWHGESGVHLVRALISQATGDLAGMGAAVGRFVAASEHPCDNLDLMSGRSGTLLGCALLLEALPRGLDGSDAALRGLAAFTGRAVTRSAAAGAAVGEGARSDLNMAHGWGGQLFAVLRWASASRSDPPPWVRTRLDELAHCGERDGRLTRWRSGNHDAVPRRYLPSWCNGSAGLAQLWLLAGRVFPGARFEALAERAAWHAWQSPHEDADLCCGRTGRAYAMLSVYRATGARRWLDRARSLADAAAEHPKRFRSTYRMSLTKGHSGLALLAADLSRPEDACMPLLEEEGWPAGASPDA